MTACFLSIFLNSLRIYSIKNCTTSINPISKFTILDFVLVLNVPSAADVGEFPPIEDVPQMTEFILFFISNRGKNLFVTLALSATAEPSFSATGRLKTWLQSSMDKLPLSTLLFYICTRTSIPTVLQSRHHLLKTTASVSRVFWKESFTM